MATYEQVTELRLDDVLDLCHERGWLTNYTREELRAFRRKILIADLFESPEEWVGNLQAIAEDIKAHNKTELSVPDIMYLIDMAAIRFFVAA